MSSPSPATSTFIRVAIVGGTAITALVLLWVMEVVPFSVFIGGLVVVAVAEGLAIMNVVRRMQQEARPARVDTTVEHGTVGYDPMDGLPGITGRSGDGR